MLESFTFRLGKLSSLVVQVRHAVVVAVENMGPVILLIAFLRAPNVISRTYL